jgi:anti-sigma regulatory factor (Ser/Thr protein kinase)
MDEIVEMDRPVGSPSGGGEPEEPNGAMVLYPVPESVARARRWFRHLVEPRKPACSVEDCVYVISELVTNAILYGEAEEEWRVRVEWWREGTALRVAVHNPGAPARVHRRLPAEDSEHGRGLWIVDELANSWDVGPSDFGGTVVSFVMADAWPA